MNRALWTAVGVTACLLGGASVVPTMNWAHMQHAMARIAASGVSLGEAFQSVPLEARLVPGIGLLVLIAGVRWIQHLHRSPRRVVLDLARRQLPLSAIARRTRMSQDAVRGVLLGDPRGGKRLRTAGHERKILPHGWRLPALRLPAARDRLPASGLR